MDITAIQVVPGPANYYSHPGALARLSDLYSEAQLSQAVWLYGERAIQAARPFLPAAFSLSGARHLQYGGHCTDPDLARLAQAAGDDRQVVIGVNVNDPAQIDPVIAHTLRPKESIHALPIPVTPDSLREAFLHVESLGR